MLKLSQKPFAAPDPMSVSHYSRDPAPADPLKKQRVTKANKKVVTDKITEINHSAAKEMTVLEPKKTFKLKTMLKEHQTSIQSKMRLFEKVVADAQKREAALANKDSD